MPHVRCWSEPAICRAGDCENVPKTAASMCSKGRRFRRIAPFAVGDEFDKCANGSTDGTKLRLWRFTI